MFDALYITSPAGLILFHKEWRSSQVSSLQTLNFCIQNAILSSSKEQAVSSAASLGSTVNWSSFKDSEAETRWIFLIHQNNPITLSNLKFKLNDLLVELASRFVAAGSATTFANGFDGLMSSFLSKHMAGGPAGSYASAAATGVDKKVPRQFEESKKFGATLKGGATVIEERDLPGSAGSSPTSSSKSKQPRAFVAKKRGGKEGEKATGTHKKEGRSWDASGAATSHDRNAVLDFSSAQGGGDEDSEAWAIDTQGLMGDGFTLGEDGTFLAQDLQVSEKLRATAEKSSANSFFSFFSSLTSGKALTVKDLEGPITKMKEHLVGKNVAASVALHLCANIQTTLVGVKLATLSSIDTLIKEEIATSLSRILTPASSINLIHDINLRKGQGVPYSLCFVGVNGVGKSTNLSKVCFWLLQNKISCLIAACDTFRSGAVEQLKVHARNLNALAGQGGGARVELFDRGYGKDPAGIAKEAVAYAKTKGLDVVLIDTAGRMQDNEPLMRALAKLVTMNTPDKIVFVGEALVGNEAVDQLTKFNQALKDFSKVAEPRVIDGIILSKFDTIDDKVGAALTMTFVTGKPVLFVGTGQTYTDLRRMNVATIVTTLLAK